MPGLAKSAQAFRGQVMALKAPSILTFVFAIVVTVTVLITKNFGATIPFLTGNEFWALLVAHIVLLAGCMVRGF